MATKYKSVFGIEPFILNAVDTIDKGWERLSQKLGKRLDQWMGNTPKRQSRKTKTKILVKVERKRNKILAKEQDSYLDMLQSLEARKLNDKHLQRLNELEQMDLEKELGLGAEASQDIER